MNSLKTLFSPSKKSPSKEPLKNKKQTPQEMVGELKKNWTYVHEIFYIETARDNIDVAKTEIPQRLHEIVQTLVKEDDLNRLQSTVSTPNGTAADSNTGVCMEYFLNKNIMRHLCDHAFADFPQGMLLEVTKTFAQLVSDLDDRFLVQSDTHASIVKLLKFGLMGNITSGGEALDVHLASLMFNMCSKLHERPELLHIFFQELREGSKVSLGPLIATSAGEQDPEVDLETQEFPLFIYLMHFISNTTKAGDIARAALIICLEIATDAVSTFVVQRSNFCQSIVSVLSSLYSDLPQTMGTSTPAELAADPRFKAFLTILEYCQQCMVKSHMSVQRALAEEFSSSFLERNVAPQLFNLSENLDVVAAASNYIEICLRKIDHPLLTWAYADFLLRDSTYSIVDEFDFDGPVPRLLQRLDSTSAAVSHVSWRLLFTIVSTRPTPAILRLFPSVIFKAMVSRSLKSSTAPADDDAANSQDVLTVPETPTVPTLGAQIPSSVLLSSLARRYILLLPFEDTEVITNGYSEYQHDAEAAFEYTGLVLKHLQDAYPGVDLYAKGQPPLPSSISSLSSKKSAPSPATADLLSLDDTSMTPVSTPNVPPITMPVQIPNVREDPFKFILLRHLSPLMTSPEGQNLLVTGIVTGLALFPHPLLFSNLFNIHGGHVEQDARSIHGALMQMSRSVARSFGNRQALVSSLPESAMPRSTFATAPHTPSKTSSPSSLDFASNLIVFEEFVKELTAAVQVQSLEGSERVLFVEDAAKL